jgi:hypothetical protein
VLDGLFSSLPQRGFSKLQLDEDSLGDLSLIFSHFPNIKEVVSKCENLKSNPREITQEYKTPVLRLKRI